MPEEHDERAVALGYVIVYTAAVCLCALAVCGTVWLCCRIVGAN